MSVKYTTFNRIFHFTSFILPWLSCCRLVEEAPAGAAVGLLDGYGLPTCQVITADTHGFQRFIVDKI